MWHTRKKEWCKIIIMAVGLYEVVLHGIFAKLQREAGRSCWSCGATHRAAQKSTMLMEGCITGGPF